MLYISIHFEISNYQKKIAASHITIFAKDFIDSNSYRDYVVVKIPIITI